MQYGKSLDDYVEILLDGNSGDYANSWLFGDTNTNEILRIELGLEFHNVERTKNGYFIGFNATYDPQIRNIECVNSGFYDVRRHQGARYVRLGELMDENKGKLNLEIAKKIIADHYDVYLQKENKCSRTVCSHYDLDSREYMSAPGRPLPFAPHGAVDGFVCDSKMAEDMIICGRYGSSCGTAFIKDDFIKNHRQYEVFSPYLKDRPSEEWTNLSAQGEGQSKNEEVENKNKENDQQEGGKTNKTKSKFRLTRKSKGKIYRKKISEKLSRKKCILIFVKTLFHEIFFVKKIIAIIPNDGS
jgi:hypothetical protein